MANVVEYIFSLQDQMSSKLQAISGSSFAVVGKLSALQAQSKKTSELLQGTGNSVGSLREKLNLLRNERDWLPQSNLNAIKRYNSEIQKLEGQIKRLDSAGMKSQSSFSEAFNSLPMAGLLTNPLVLAGATAGNAIRLGIEKDLQTTSFEVLLGSEEASKKLMADITEYASKTPYEKMGLGDATKTMLGFGIAQEKVMPNLKAIGDIAMGDANKMSSLTLAFSQVSSAGKLQGQDLLQMINAGFNPLNEISKTTGKSMAVLRKEMEQGKITSKMVEDAFRSATSEGGQFNGMADKMSQTIGGRLSTLMDTINEKFIVLYDAIQPVVGALLDLANSAINGVTSAFLKLKSWFDEGNLVFLTLTITVGSLALALGVLQTAMFLQTAYTAIVTTVTTAWTAITGALGTVMWGLPITWIIAGVIALIAVISYVVYKTDGWGKAWEHTVTGAKLIFKAFTESVKFYFNSQVDAIMIGLNKIKEGWYSFKETAGIGDSAENQKAIAQIQKDTEERKKAITDGAKQIADLSKNSMSEFAKAGNSLTWNNKTLSDVTSDLKTKIGIEPPKLAGAQTPADGTNLEDKKRSKAKQTNEAIATGGSKHNYITINLDNLIGVSNINANSTKEGINRMQEDLTDALLRTLGMATTTAG